MKRTINKINRVDAILTADWHLRDDQPVCRTDDFLNTQFEKVKYVSRLQQTYNCPVLHAGDLFHHWKPSPFLLTKTIQCLPDHFYTVYGNHDLPQHNMELSSKSGIAVLEAARVLHVLRSGHWGDEKPKSNYKIIRPGMSDREILVWHVFTWSVSSPFPGVTTPDALKLLMRNKEFDLILTGDNHQPFVTRLDGRLLVNPGSLMRQSADQQDYKPAVWLYDAQANTAVPHYIPIEQGVVSREHITDKEERDSRIQAFISKLNDDWESVLSFEENLRRFLEVNVVRPEVKSIIYKALES